jgi:hypothetical protein
MRLDTTAATKVPSSAGQLPTPHVEGNGGPIVHIPTSLRQHIAPSPLTSSLYEPEPRHSPAFYQDGALYQSTAPSTYTSVNPYFDGFFNLNPPSLNGQPQGVISVISATAAATAVFKQLAGQENVHLRLEDQKSLGGEDAEEEDHNRSGAPLDREAGTGGGNRPGENVTSFDASSPVNSFGELPLTSLSRRGTGGQQVSVSTSTQGKHTGGGVFIQGSDLAVLENTIQATIERGGVY